MKTVLLISIFILSYLFSFGQNLKALDDKNGFRGCAHRPNQVQSHMISEEMASPGFIKGTIPKGIFRVIISVHDLVTEECTYKIKIVERGDDNNA